MSDDAVVTTRTRNRWLDDVAWSVRKSTVEKSIRLILDDGNPVNLYM